VCHLGYRWDYNEFSGCLAITRSAILDPTIRGAQTAFAGKHVLITQAQDLTKKSMASLLHFVSVFAVSHSL
jgi:hypothetical protein